MPGGFSANPADTAWLALRKIDKRRSDAGLGMLQREVTLKYRRPSAEEVAEARAVLAVKDKEVIQKCRASPRTTRATRSAPRSVRRKR